MADNNSVSGRSSTVPSDLPCEKYHLFPSLRLAVCVFAFIGITFNSTLYSSVYFGWVCMVNATFTDPTASNEDGGTLLWGAAEQRYIFAAYGLGGLLVVLPAGWLTDKFGVRFILAGSVSLAAVASLVTQVAVMSPYGIPLMVFLRILVGIGGSTMFVTVYGIVSHWSPKVEMGAMLGLMLSGLQTGQFLNMLLSGVFCEKIGWPFIFYFWGTIGIVFSVIWVMTYRNNPEEVQKVCPKKEKHYICKNRAFEGGNMEKPSPPWLKILTSMSVWTQMITSFCGFYLIFMVNEYTPTFMKEALHMSDEATGFESALPFIVQILGRVIAGPLSDRTYPWIKTKTTLVKIFNAVALLGGAITMFALTFAEKGVPRWVPVLLLCLSLFFLSFATGGYYKNPLFLAPQFSATIGALSTISGMLATVILPFIVSAMTPKGTAEEWVYVFYVAVAVGVFGTVFFLIFGTAELQSWARTAPVQDINVIELETVSKNTANGAAKIDFFAGS